VRIPVIVGWVEPPCETHQPQVLMVMVMVMGFAKSSTHPTDPFLGTDRREWGRAENPRPDPFES
jgi:hypothetical protein